MRVGSWVLAGLCVLAWVRCSGDMAESRASDPGWNGGGGGAEEPDEGCTSHAQCPLGYTCEEGVCVRPEEEADALAARAPVTTTRFLFTLFPAANSIAKIDPATLEIEAIPVPTGPADLLAVPGSDRLCVLSNGSPALALIDASERPARVEKLALGRWHDRLSVSADGRWAVAWTSASTLPEAGASGAVTLISLETKRTLERPVGYRVSNVILQASGVAQVVTKDAIVSVALDLAEGQALPLRVALPEEFSSDMAAREVAATPDGARFLLRSTTAPRLLSFDGAALTAIELPEVATDLDLLPDGTMAIAALRSSKQLVLIALPSLATTTITTTLSVGQVVLPRANSGFALGFSSVSGNEWCAKIALPSGEVTRFELEKQVAQVALTDDGAKALIIHRPQPESDALDPYELAIDRANGFSVLDVASGFALLTSTGEARPGPFALSSSQRYAAVASTAGGAHRLDVVDFASLISSEMPLRSPPLFAGAVADGDSIFVAQEHPAGRLSFVDLATKSGRTVTGFTLNAEIE